MVAHKKGLAWTATILLSIVGLLISGYFITNMVLHAAEKIDEEFEVKSCKLANGLLLGIQEQLGIDTPKSCFTIDKTLEKDKKVPSGSQETKEGAANEIKNMVHNCWDMWYGHDVNNAFSKLPGIEGCFTCYIFLLNEDAEGLTVDLIQESLEEPYEARDISDKCSKFGGFCKSECEDDESSSLNQECSNKYSGMPIC